MTSHRFVLSLGVVIGVLSVATAEATPVTWVNESNLVSEADFAVLQFPATMTVTAGTLTPNVFGRIFEAGVTQSGGANAAVLADVGYGAIGSDPRIDSSWIWIAGVFNVQLGNDDEYHAQFLAPLVNGTYSYTFRFSVDSGLTYTAADLDGAGSNAQLTFDAANLGTLTVVGGQDAIPTPEPTSMLLVATGCGYLLRRRSKR